MADQIDRKQITDHALNLLDEMRTLIEGDIFGVSDNFKGASKELLVVVEELNSARLLEREIEKQQWFHGIKSERD